jgi:hypothetical protein
MRRVGVVGFGVAVLTASAGTDAAGGTGPLVGDGAADGAADGADVEAGWFGASVFAPGVPPAPLTVAEDPAGIDISTPSALVSTVPEIVTTVVSPVGLTVTDDSEPARITDAIPDVRTS